MKRRLTGILLAVAMLFAAGLPLRITASATAERDVSYEENMAGILKQLGVFKGVSETDFALTREPSRAEAIVMLIRLLGKESEAMAGSWRHPFQDVPAWADKYVGYAYQKSLTNGISATEFGAGNTSAGMYLTFVLRALNYSDADEVDFTWQNPYDLARQVGILDERVDIYSFLRADVANISYLALKAKLKNSATTLAQKLIADGVFTQLQYDTYYGAQGQPTIPAMPTDEYTAQGIYAKCAPSVFYLEVYDEKNRPMTSGSGFFVSADGLAVTNYHVINGCSSAMATLSGDGSQRAILGVYNYNVEEDWAVIKVDGEGYTPLEVSDRALVGGEKIYAIGSPLGLQNSITEGLVSNASRDEGGVKYVQISAAISPGSSGGALITSQGKVAGITSATYKDGQNLNLALPLFYVNTAVVGTYTTFEALRQNEGQTVEDPLAVLKAYLVRYGDMDYYDGSHSVEGTSFISYSLKTTGINDREVKLSYSIKEDDEETVYITESYEAVFSRYITTLYFEGAGSDEFAMKAIFSYLDRGNPAEKWGVGYVFLDRGVEEDIEYSIENFSLDSWQGDGPMTQEVAELTCYSMIYDLICAADGIFEAYGMPITMEDFGFTT